MPLDPENLTPTASINRVRIVDLPGVEMPAEVKGKTAYELCGLHVLVTLIRESAADLNLAPVEIEADTDLPRVLARCLDSGEARQREAAVQLCARYGQRLGYIIATLKRGDLVNREAREEWDESYWQHWAGIRRVWLGGGLASGALGEALQEQATRVLRSAGVLDCEVRAAPYAAILPLVGLARVSEAEEPAALVFDFGQTKVKSGVAIYDSRGALSWLDVAPDKPAFGPNIDVSESMAQFVADAVVNTSSNGAQLAHVIFASLATYIQDNHPSNYKRGPYSVLHVDSPNLGDWLSSRVSKLTGRSLEVRLLHDGTAAAHRFAGASQTAVIMLGTALGVGFPSLLRPALPLAPGFEIRFAE